MELRIFHTQYTKLLKNFAFIAIYIDILNLLHYLPKEIYNSTQICLFCFSEVEKLISIESFSLGLAQVEIKVGKSQKIT